jgi:hypothetical protein
MDADAATKGDLEEAGPDDNDLWPYGSIASSVALAFS